MFISALQDFFSALARVESLIWGYTSTTHMSSDPSIGYLLYIGDITPQLYRDYDIYHYKDPYEPTTIMSCQGFERCSHHYIESE